LLALVDRLHDPVLVPVDDARQALELAREPTGGQW
jgi:hypothetical protein